MMPRAPAARRLPRAWSLRALFAAALSVLFVALAPGRAVADFKPPPISGHVVDTAGRLSAEEIRRLDRKLDAVRRQTGFEIVAFVVGSLEGAPIEDVAYEAFNTWKIGRERLDNGVLLVIAPAERRIRIETGKGVGGALTDLQSNDIIRQQVAPALQQGRFYEAVDRGTSAIAEALTKGTPGSATKAPPEGALKAPPDPVKVALGAGLLVLTIVLAIVSPAFRSVLWFLLHILLMSRWGGGGRGGGFGGSGYGGGGGRSGGGGSSDSY